MTGPTTYAEITREVDAIVERHIENDPTVCTYMVARAALILVRGIRGSERAAELAYSIADELAGAKL